MAALGEMRKFRPDQSIGDVLKSSETTLECPNQSGMPGRNGAEHEWCGPISTRSDEIPHKCVSRRKSLPWNRLTNKKSQTRFFPEWSEHARPERTRIRLSRRLSIAKTTATPISSTAVPVDKAYPDKSFGAPGGVLQSKWRLRRIRTKVSMRRRYGESAHDESAHSESANGSVSNAKLKAVGGGSPWDEWTEILVWVDW